MTIYLNFPDVIQVNFDNHFSLISYAILYVFFILDRMISTVFSTHPPSYILRDEKGQEIQGKFYEAENIKILK